ncbi:hypothetical protein P153DRAFT_402117 [Dothidotthia symphoricarpi CBS 119687]|uniref:Uncharacterized protein n=1 Tax=Dothidotthia symphoricarpi CBS 119687 TaxID=1392245 RepID=A0A6A6ATW9_9PLEO|nr:uncharacterized protein P153DRAFT_402117 [Dothidotthia symphoricarpi CBS 119687]KAF2134405.1 hypothetical protein P153DRAFT_402117 [Dothidotthia symphoricarpi CBS 119687]
MPVFTTHQAFVFNPTHPTITTTLNTSLNSLLATLLLWAFLYLIYLSLQFGTWLGNKVQKLVVNAFVSPEAYVLSAVTTTSLEERSGEGVVQWRTERVVRIRVLGRLGGEERVLEGSVEVRWKDGDGGLSTGKEARVGKVRCRSKTI